MSGPQSSQTTPVPGGLPPGDLSPAGGLAHPQPGYTDGQIPVEQHTLGTLGTKYIYILTTTVVWGGFVFQNAATLFYCEAPEI